MVRHRKLFYSEAGQVLRRTTWLTCHRPQLSTFVLSAFVGLSCLLRHNIIVV
jgi:hypothetical protein